MINTLTHVLVNFGLETLSKIHFSINTDKDLCIEWMYFLPCPEAAFKLFTDITTSTDSKTLQLVIHSDAVIRNPHRP